MQKNYFGALKPDVRRCKRRSGRRYGSRSIAEVSVIAEIAISRSCFSAKEKQMQMM
jgi:hypothetical protein